MIYSHQALKYIPVYYIRVAQFHLGNLKEIWIKKLHRLLINQRVLKHSTEQQKKILFIKCRHSSHNRFLKIMIKIITFK